MNSIESNSFYVTIASNSSMEYFKENKISDFKVQLPQRIYLEDDYEVALVETNIPSKWNDIGNDIYFTIYKLYKKEKNSVHITSVFIATIHIPSKNYPVLDEFISELNHTSIQKHVKFSFNYDSFKGEIELNKNTHIICSSELSKRFGFKKTEFINLTDSVAKYETEGEIVIKKEISSIYIYSSLIAPQIVADKSAPLIRIIHFGKLEDNQTSITKEFHNPFYFPLLYKSFQIIEINLRDTFGDFIPFLSNNPSIFVFHFKKIKEGL